MRASTLFNGDIVESCTGVLMTPGGKNGNVDNQVFKDCCDLVFGQIYPIVLPDMRIVPR